LITTITFFQTPFQHQIFKFTAPNALGKKAENLSLILREKVGVEIKFATILRFSNLY